MDRPFIERQLDLVAPLTDPVRRRLYLYVISRRRDVGRDEAARALRIARPLAAFHLDKLAEAGLLETSYRRLSRRPGPGAGRPAKLYRRAANEVSVAIPERQYELAGRLLVEAIADARSPAATRALGRVAAALGKRAGEAARHEGASAEEVLTRWGYEPTKGERPGETELRNCPFEALARQCAPVVCRMNVALVGGVLEGLGAKGLKAQFKPQPGLCCVVVGRVKRR